MPAATPRRLAHRIQTWVELAGRFGYLAKALVYLLIGTRALQAVLVPPRVRPDATGAAETLREQPFGPLVLAAPIAGLFGYALWQAVAAVVDGEHDGAHLSGRLVRIGKVGGALGYGALGLACVHILVEGGTRPDQTQRWTGAALRWPAGPALVTLAGLAVLGYSVAQVLQLRQPLPGHQVNRAALGPQLTAVVIWMGRASLLARAVVFGLIGTYLVRAATGDDARAAAGLAETLLALCQHRGGTVGLLALGLGLAAYGGFQAVQARYRRLDPARAGQRTA